MGFLRFLMRGLACAALVLVASRGAALAQPVVAGLQNNYSFLIPGTPNYGIAQGSIFAIFGSNMAPEGLLQQGFEPALDRNLGGVSIRIAAAGVTTEAIPYFVSPGQIAAILPSATPAGAVSLTVSYDGRTSAPFPFEVRRSAFGILTLGGNGLGMAAVHDLDFRLLALERPARPGQIVQLWGTGLGPDSNDETRLIAAPRNLDEVPFEFYVGNRPARVVYHGRSAFPGLDQIAVEIPEGVSGCYASAYAKTGAVASNFVTIPVAAEGEVCSDWFYSGAETGAMLASGRPTLDLGWLYLIRFLIRSPAVAGQPAQSIVQESATAQFERATVFDSLYWNATGGFANPGCVVSAWPTQRPFVSPIVRNLDAGPRLDLVLPDGSTRGMTPQGSFYAYSESSATPGAQLFVPPGGGEFRFRIPGGADIAMGEAAVRAVDALVWREYETVSAVERDRDLTVTWSGGEPGGFVLVRGFSYAGAAGEIFTTFGCTAPVEAGSYTVPRDVLASMVASSGPSAAASQLSVIEISKPARFAASGLDNGSISWQTSFLAPVVYR